MKTETKHSSGELCLGGKHVHASLAQIEQDSLEPHIVVEDFWTPFDIEARYGSNRGSIYGVACDRRRNFAFKAPKQSSRFRNLFFVGGSVNPGGGMPMVTLRINGKSHTIEAVYVHNWSKDPWAFSCERYPYPLGTLKRFWPQVGQPVRRIPS